MGVHNSCYAPMEHWRSFEGGFEVICAVCGCVLAAYYDDGDSHDREDDRKR